MNCTYCGKPITLVPSANERAEKYGGKPSDYTNLFTTHAECQIAAWYGRRNPHKRAEHED